MIAQRGAPLYKCRDIGFSLTGPVNWARRTAEVEATANKVQEGHQAIGHAFMEKKMNARGLGAPLMIKESFPVLSWHL